MTSDTPTPRTDAWMTRAGALHPLVGVVESIRCRQIERELSVALSRLELWRSRAFDANSNEEFVEIDGLIGELKAMRREFEEGKP